MKYLFIILLCLCSFEKSNAQAIKNIDTLKYKTLAFLKKNLMQLPNVAIVEDFKKKQRNIMYYKMEDNYSFIRYYLDGYPIDDDDTLQKKELLPLISSKYYPAIFKKLTAKNNLNENDFCVTIFQVDSLYTPSKLHHQYYYNDVIVSTKNGIKLCGLVFKYSTGGTLINYYYENYTKCASQINSNDEAERFLRFHYPEYRLGIDSMYFPPNPSNFIVDASGDTLSTNGIMLSDVNADGINDVITCYKGSDGPPSVIALCDKGDRYEVFDFKEARLFDGIAHYGLTKLFLNGQNVYVINCYNADTGIKAQVKTDTFLYKFGKIINYSSNKTSHKIRKIVFETHGCYGECPIFELDVWPNGQVKYNAKKFNKVKGIFRYKIKPQRVAEIIDILNYLNFADFKQVYRPEGIVTDLPGCYLTIYYDDKQVKKIYDYGYRGPKGLQEIYNMLFDLRKN